MFYFSIFTYLIFEFIPSIFYHLYSCFLTLISNILFLHYYLDIRVYPLLTKLVSYNNSLQHYIKKCSLTIFQYYYMFFLLFNLICHNWNSFSIFWFSSRMIISFQTIILIIPECVHCSQMHLFQSVQPLFALPHIQWLFQYMCLLSSSLFLCYALNETTVAVANWSFNIWTHHKMFFQQTLSLTNTYQHPNQLTKSSSDSWYTENAACTPSLGKKSTQWYRVENGLLITSSFGVTS